MRAGRQWQGCQGGSIVDADHCQICRTVATAYGSSDRVAVWQNDIHLFSPASKVTRRHNDAGLPVNTTCHDAVTGINRYDCFSRLLGETSRSFRDGFPDSVYGTAHCLLLMLRTLLRVQASHSRPLNTSGEWLGKPDFADLERCFDGFASRYRVQLERRLLTADRQRIASKNRNR
jgi:hypothetical protein